MSYVQGIDRNQITMTSLDAEIEPTNTVRIIDAFVESLTLSDFGYVAKGENYYAGRSSYDPKSLFKLFIYGNRNNIRSSRKLQRACKINIEVMWLMKGVKPDFRTISDFRKDNIDVFKKIFHEFNSRLVKAEKIYIDDLKKDSSISADTQEERVNAMIEGIRFQSVDGSKFQTCNSKDRNFTLSKLDDRIKRMDFQSEDYLRQLEQADEYEDGMDDEPVGHLTKEQLLEKLESIEERRKKYKEYLDELEKTGETQKSLTDPESKLMKNKNGYAVSYNPQVAVDSATDLISDYNMTNNATDHGMLKDTVKDLKKDDEILQVVADKGYHETEDMVDCLKSGIIPNVIPDDGKDSFELESDYKASEDADSLKANTDSESIKKCIEAGVIPDAYQGIITDMEVTEKRYKVYEDNGESVTAAKRTESEMKARASQGYFVRDLDNDKVYCPNGEILRKKSVTKSGAIRYANKLACKNCPLKDKCMKGKTSSKYPFKEVEFGDKVIEKPIRGWDEKAEETSRKILRLSLKYHMGKRTVVRFRFTPNRQMMDKRKCLSEHVFGTMKRTMDGGYFLLKGMRKVIGEFALICLGYNLQRAMNLFGFERMMKVMAG